MAGSERTQKTEYLLTGLVLLVLAAYLLVFGFVDFRGFPRLATSDMYEDTLCARLMWEAKSLFPKRFLFGNQFYVIATPVLAALFYDLTGSMNTGMALATTVMSLLILLSMDWMLRPALKKPWQRLAALLGFVGLFIGAGIRSEDGPQLFFVMCSFYACYVITNFVVLGDYARARLSAKRRIPALILACFLCFCTGMQSLRQTCVTILPLLCFEALGVIRRLCRREPVFPSDRRPVFLRVGVYTLANILGVVFIRLLPLRQHTIYRGASLLNGSSLREELVETGRALSAVTGLDFVMGQYGSWFSLLLFLFCMTLIAAAIVFLLRDRKAAFDDAAFFWLLSVIACAAAIAAAFFTAVSLRPVYLFPYYTLPALSYVILVRRMKPGHAKVLSAVLALFAAANLYLGYRYDVQAVTSPDPTTPEKVCQFAMDHGYRYVYGNASHTSPIIAVYSDGALIAGGWDDEIIFKLTPYINIRDIYSLSDYKDAVFVFLPSEMPRVMIETEGNGAELTFQGEFGEYLVYTSSKQLLYPITETIDYNPEYN